jgi:hypothetical protein|mmetsp:Transcript_19825/g.32185  ORF Transcript_19825/g.32185 Transcript_19825/m.32185 type:complete len:96 (-) Transcript_19825:65-352(-)
MNETCEEVEEEVDEEETAGSERRPIVAAGGSLGAHKKAPAIPANGSAAAPPGYKNDGFWEALFRGVGGRWHATAGPGARIVGEGRAPEDGVRSAE